MGRVKRERQPIQCRQPQLRTAWWTDINRTDDDPYGSGALLVGARRIDRAGNPQASLELGPGWFCLEAASIEICSGWRLEGLVFRNSLPKTLQTPVNTRTHWGERLRSG